MALGTFLERRLEEAYPQYRRIWVQYCNKGQYHLCITVFPIDGAQYRQLFGHASVLDFESVSRIIQKDLDLG